MADFSGDSASARPHARILRFAPDPVVFETAGVRKIGHGAQHRFGAADQGEVGIGAVDLAVEQFLAFRSVETAGEKFDLQSAPLQDVDDVDAANIAVLLFWRLLRNSSRISRANQERLAIVYFMTKSDNNSRNVSDSFSFDA